MMDDGGGVRAQVRVASRWIYRTRLFIACNWPGLRDTYIAWGITRVVLYLYDL